MKKTLMIVLAGLTLLAAVTMSTGGKKAVETVVTLETTRGDIVLRFFPDSAPEHVKNFLEHSRADRYTGTYFHRVIPGFMIQGGDFNTRDEDPQNDGFGGWSYHGEGKMLDAEFNDRKHLRGILSMARSQDPNSAGSQFFVMHADAPFLDGKYTVFGECIDGIEVVDAIVSTKRDKRDRPLENQTIRAVKVEEWKTSKVEETRSAMRKSDPAAG